MISACNGAQICSDNHKSCFDDKKCKRNNWDATSFCDLCKHSICRAKVAMKFQLDTLNYTPHQAIPIEFEENY